MLRMRFGTGRVATFLSQEASDASQNKGFGGAQKSKVTMEASA